MQSFKNLSASEWEKIEREEHDDVYRSGLSFDLAAHRIDPKHVIWQQDYCYKPGRRKDRGHRTKRVFELMNLNSLAGKRILDVGCGNGHFSVFFALFGAEVYGCDISPVGIKVAERIAEANDASDRCHFSVQNASHFDYPDEFFDIVLYHEVLHHAIKYPNVREETLRVLKKGGLTICAENLSGNIFLKFGRRFTMRGEEAKGDVDLTIADLEKFAQGFSEHRLEFMSLFFMGKRILQEYLDHAPARWLVYLLKRTDDVVLGLFPSMERYCGECVLVLKK